VILMPTENLRRLAGELLAHGRAADTQVALIRWGTTEAQETRVITLADAAAGGTGDLQPPVVAVVGQVVGLRERLRWFDPPSADESEVAPPAVGRRQG
jgi:siroheme synthase